MSESNHPDNNEKPLSPNLFTHKDEVINFWSSLAARVDTVAPGFLKKSDLKILNMASGWSYESQAFLAYLSDPHLFNVDNSENAILGGYQVLRALGVINLQYIGDGNLEAADLSNRINMIKMDGMEFIDYTHRHGMSFDFVLLRSPKLMDIFKGQGVFWESIIPALIYSLNKGGVGYITVANDIEDVYFKKILKGRLMKQAVSDMGVKYDMFINDPTKKTSPYGEAFSYIFYRS